MLGRNGVHNVGGAEFDETVGKEWWKYGLGSGSLPGMKEVVFSDVEGNGEFLADGLDEMGAPASLGGSWVGGSPRVGVEMEAETGMMRTTPTCQNWSRMMMMRMGMRMRMEMGMVQPRVQG